MNRFVFSRLRWAFLLIGLMLAACKGPVEAEQVRDFAAVCSGRPVSNAAVYRAEGPNPAAVFLAQPQGGLGLDYRVFNPPTDDPAFFSYRLRDNPNRAVSPTGEVAATAIVACGRYEKGGGKYINMCTLKDSREKDVQVPLYAVHYKTEIREARTGKKLGDGIFTGAKPDCPITVFYEAGTGARACTPTRRTRRS